MDERNAGKPLDSGRIEIPTRREAIVEAQQQVLSALDRTRIPDTGKYAVRLALEEAISNAFKHGNASDPARNISIEYTIWENGIRIDVEDEGEGFDPSAVPDPTADENLVIPSGRGLMLMHAYMNEVIFSERGSRVSMRYLAC